MNLLEFRDRERIILKKFEFNVDVLLEVYKYNDAQAVSEIKAVHANTKQELKNLDVEFLNSPLVEDPFALSK